MSTEQELTGSGPADPLKVRDFWLDVVRPAADRGKLEKVPTRRARNLRERSQAKTQNYYLTRKSFGGFGDRYDLIQWGSRGNGYGEAA